MSRTAEESSFTSAASEATPDMEMTMSVAEKGMYGKTTVERNIVEVRKLLSKFADHKLQTDLLVLIIENMRRKKMLTDMIFVCQECGEVPAHRSIVSVMSGYCQRIFENNENASSITLPLGVTTDSMRRLLDFMYTGELPIPDSLIQVREVMTAARFLEMRLFNEAVALALKKSITLDNFRNIWEMAEDFENDHLVDAVVNTVSKDFQSLGCHREMNDLSTKYLIMLLSSKSVKANPPEEVLEAVLGWVHREPTQRIVDFQQHMLPLFSFDKMPLSYLRNLHETETLVKKCPKFLDEIENYVSAWTSPREKNAVQLHSSHSLESQEGFDIQWAKCCALPENRPATAPPVFKRNGKDFRQTPRLLLPKRPFGTDLASVIAGAEDDSATITFPTLLFTSPSNSPSKANRPPSPPKQHRPNVSPPKRDPAAKQKPKTGGGGSPNNGTSNELRMFIFGRKRKGEPALQSCLLPSCTWGPAVDLPTALPVNAAAAVYQNHIYFSGGNDWLLEAVDEFTVYNIRQSTIKKLCPLSWARSLPASATLGWYIYVIGGLQTDLQGINKVERYNVFSEIWETRAPLPYSAGNISAVAHEIRLYCFGGCKKMENGENNRGMDWINESCYYDHEVNQWTILGNITSGLSNGALVMCLAAGKVYVTRSIKPDAVWSFDLTTRRWKYHCGSADNKILQRMLALIPLEDKVWAIDCAGKMFMYDLTSQSWTYECPFTHSIPCPAYAVVADCNE